MNSKNKKALDLLTQILFLPYFFLSTHIFKPYLSPQAGLFEFQDFRFFFLVASTLGILLCLNSWVEIKKLLGREPWLTAWVFYMALSAVWSVDKLGSLYAAYCLLGSFFLCAHFVLSVPHEKRIGWLRNIFLSVLVLNLISPWIATGSAIVQSGEHAGCWQGLFSHKNNLGRLMLLGVVLFLGDRKRESLFLNSLLLIGSAVLLCLSGSRASMIVFFILVLFAIFYLNPFPGKLRVCVASLFFLTVIFISIFVLFGNPVREWPWQPTPKDTLLANRSVFWPRLAEKAQTKIFTGYGLQGFWTDKNPDSKDVIDKFGWPGLDHAHNAVLDLWLEGGLVGVFLFMAGFLTLIRRLFFKFSEGRASDLFGLFFVVYFISTNLVESGALWPNFIYLPLFFCVFFTTAQESHRE